MARRTYQIPYSATPTSQPPGFLEAALGWLSRRRHIPAGVRSQIRRRYTRIGDLRYFRRFSGYDIEDNDRARIPLSERVAFRGMWVVEFYTPPDVATMTRRLRQLDGMAPAAAANREFAKWFIAARTTSSGGWIRLPEFAPQGRRVLGRDQIFGPMPKGVACADAMLVGVTHGISALVVRFEYDDDFAESYGELIREDQGKILEPLGNGFSIIGPSFLKTRKVKSWREARIAEASAWVAANYPGHFARSGEHLPSVHLITTAESLPWDPDSPQDGLDGYGILDLRFFGQPYWQCSDLTALKVRIANEGGPHLGKDHEGVLVCAAREAELLSEEPVGVGEHYSSSFSHAMHGLEENFSDIAVRWGLYSYVQRLGAQVAVVRDRATAISSVASYSAFVALRNRLLATGIESQLVAKEIVSFCQSWRWSERSPDYDELLPSFYRDSGREPVKLHTALADRIIEETRRIAYVEKEIRELVSAAAGLTNAAYGIRLQAVVLWLTIISVIVAIIALVVAL